MKILGAVGLLLLLAALGHGEVQEGQHGRRNRGGGEDEGGGGFCEYIGTKLNLNNFSVLFTFSVFFSGGWGGLWDTFIDVIVVLVIVLVFGCCCWVCIAACCCEDDITSRGEVGKDEAVGDDDYTSCYLCTRKIRQDLWESGEHRRRCAEENADILEVMEEAHKNVTCPRCGKCLKLFPARGQFFICQGGGCEQGHSSCVNTGTNRFNCFICDYDLCLTCMNKRVNGTGYNPYSRPFPVVNEATPLKSDNTTTAEISGPKPTGPPQPSDPPPTAPPTLPYAGVDSISPAPPPSVPPKTGLEGLPPLPPLKVT